jgi:hypothetical protein
MDGIADREMIVMGSPMRLEDALHAIHLKVLDVLREESAQPAIRPEMLDVLRNGYLRDKDVRERQNYQNAFDRLISLFGRSAEMALASCNVASNLAKLIGDRDPIGWRCDGETYGDPALEKAVREFEEFESLFLSLARKLFPIATQMRDCFPAWIHEGSLLYKDFEYLRDLVTALQPFVRPRARAADPRSEWHATATLFAERIEAHFRTLRLEPPKRNSVRSPLVLAVQSLLDMVGLRVEVETIRKVLRPVSQPSLFEYVLQADHSPIHK